MSNKCLPKQLKGKRHDDWKIGSWKIEPIWRIPRAWTAKCGWAWPQPPKLLLGNSGWTAEDAHLFGHYNTEDHTAEDFLRDNGDVLPIPKAGNFLVSAVMWLKFIPLPMITWAFKNGDYISLGVVRWDDVDGYYDLLRIRAHGTLGRVAMGLTILAIAAIAYFFIW